MTTRPAGGRHTAHEDAVLAGLVAERDGAALEALYGRYGRSCYSLAHRIVGDQRLAQDVVQEVFLAVWCQASRFDAARGGFATWLLTLTHHKAVDLVRREENLRRRRTTDDVLSALESPAPQVHDTVWGTLQTERVRAALAAITAPQREALVLAYFGGYTQREIAGLLGIPLGTVKTRMLAGMRRLKVALAGEESNAADREPAP